MIVVSDATPAPHSADSSPIRVIVGQPRPPGQIRKSLGRNTAPTRNQRLAHGFSVQSIRGRGSELIWLQYSCPADIWKNGPGNACDSVATWKMIVHFSLHIPFLQGANNGIDLECPRPECGLGLFRTRSTLRTTRFFSMLLPDRIWLPRLLNNPETQPHPFRLGLMVS